MSSPGCLSFLCFLSALEVSPALSPSAALCEVSSAGSLSLFSESCIPNSFCLPQPPSLTSLLLLPLHSSVDSELTSLCQSVLEDFNLCLFYLPSSPNLSLASEDEEEYDSGYAFLPDLLIFQMVIICLMGVHSLKRAGNCPYVLLLSPTGFWDPHYPLLQLLIHKVSSTSRPFTICMSAWLWKSEGQATLP